MRKFLIVSMVLSILFSARADIFEINRSLGKGINLGNVFEAPDFGGWGEPYDTNHIALIAQRGFQTLRLPVRWCPEKRTAMEPPYTIAESFFEKVDEAIDCALGHDLNVVLDIHHYDELFEDPHKEWDRFKAMWEQIAERYKDYSSSLVFEILNEPNTNLTAELWNDLLAETFSIIRKTNPTRPVIIGVAEWGGISALNKLVLPEDPNIILTVHYYLPFNFTHQGASWVENSMDWVGTTWEGTYYEKKAVIDDMEYIRAYSEENSVPVFLGEFGAITLADLQSRVNWSSFCARLFEKYDFSWAYWAFGAGFDVYDKEEEKWTEPLAEALLSSDTSILAMEKDSITGRNIVRNGTFADESNWELNLNTSAAEATGVVENNSYSVTVVNPDTANWNIQLIQSELILKKDHSYLLVFDVYADSERTIAAAVDRCPPPDYVFSMHAANWDVQVTKEKKTVTLPFNAAFDDSLARVTFYLGGSGAGDEATTVHFSNVSLYEEESAVSIMQNRRLANNKKPGSFTAKVSKHSVYLAFDKKVNQPISVSLLSLSGRVIYRGENLDVSASNSIDIPISTKSKSPVVLQVKHGSAIESRVLFNGLN